MQFNFIKQFIKQFKQKDNQMATNVTYPDGMTLGEFKVRLGFSSNPKVTEVKRIYADMINQVSEEKLDDSKPRTDGEVQEFARNKAIVMAKLEEACEKHVKLITS